VYFLICHFLISCFLLLSSYLAFMPSYTKYKFKYRCLCKNFAIYPSEITFSSDFSVLYSLENLILHIYQFSCLLLQEPQLVLNKFYRSWYALNIISGGGKRINLLTPHSRSGSFLISFQLSPDTNKKVKTSR
jgi:hypothetical protein